MSHDNLSTLSIAEIQKKKEKLYQLGSQNKPFDFVKKAVHKFLMGHN